MGRLYNKSLLKNIFSLNCYNTWKFEIEGENFKSQPLQVCCFPLLSNIDQPKLCLPTIIPLPQVFEFWSLFVRPLTESDYGSHDSMWLYVIGWIVYLFTWSMIIGIAVWQISAQVDYNFSQVSRSSYHRVDEIAVHPVSRCMFVFFFF